MVLYNPMASFGQQLRSQAVHSSPSSVKSSTSSPAQFFHHHHPPAPPSPTSSSSTFLYCSASSASMEPFPSHHQHHCCCCCSPCPSNQQQHCLGHVPLRKSRSVHGRPLNGASSRGAHCAWESDGPPPSPRSLREGRVKNSGFLRGLFSPSPQRKHSPMNKTTMTNSSRRRATASKEMYGTLWEEEPEQTQHDTNPNSSDWCIRQQRGEVARAADEQQQPKGGRSFFARLKGFKRTNSTSLGTKRENSNGTSFDDSSGILTQMSPEVLRARQLAFRRTNTDTGGGAIASALVRLKSLNEGTAQKAASRTNRENIHEQSPRNFNFPLARVLPQPRKMTSNDENGETLKMRGEEQERRRTPAGEKQRPKFTPSPIEEICSASSLRRQGNNTFLMDRNKSAFPPPLLRHHSNISMPIDRLLQQKGTTMDSFPISAQHLPITSKSLRQNKAMDSFDRPIANDENFGDVGSWNKGNGEHRFSTSTTNSSRTSKTAIAAVRPQLKQMQLNGISTKLRKAPDVPEKSQNSDYSLLGDLFSHRKNDQRNRGDMTNSQREAGHGKMDETTRHGLVIADEEEDAHSLAGTDFNEPWDSNAWENLMDLARFGDGPMGESPRVSEIETDNLEMMEKAAKMVNCSRTQFPQFTAGAHRRSLMRVHGTNSLMDISGIGSSKARHALSADVDEPAKRNGLNFGQNSIVKQQHHNHRTAPACSSSVDELNAQPTKSTSICPSLVPVFLPFRLRNLAHEHPGEADPAKVIQRYVEDLSKDDQTLFEAALHQFVECTLLSREKDPYVVIRRVRQFITGMKNYLMKIGEADLHPIIKRERSRLNIDEFLNIDAILEEVLDKILLTKLKAHLYRLMILESTSNGELRRLSENIAQVRAMNAAELGFAEDTELPDNARMEQICRQLRKMQNHYSPLKKVQLLLRVLSLAVPFIGLSSAGGSDHSSRQRQMNEFSPHTPKAHQSSSSSSSYYALSPALSTMRQRTTSGSSSFVTAAALKHPPADELIRWLVYLLARSSTINCEIEAWYMWELLPQQVLNTGDASYFLSILFSAVHVLKHPESIRRLKNVELARNQCIGVHQSYPFADFMGSQSTLQDFDESDLLLRVAILNEHEGTIEYHSFPTLPKMTVAKLCRMIAHQFSVTNPEDYRLYLIFDDYESPPLEPNQIPHLLRSQMNETERPHHLFVYKRADVNISYPGQAVANFFGSNTTVLMNPPPLVIANVRGCR